MDERTFGGAGRDLRTARRFAMFSTAMLAAVTAQPLLRDIPEVTALAHTPLHWVVVSAWTGVAGALLVAWGTGPASAPRALLRACGLGLVLGVVNAGLSYASLVALRDGLEIGPFCGNVLLGMLGGALDGGLRGLGFGLAAAPVVCQLAVSGRSLAGAAAHRDEPSVAASWAARRPEASSPRI